MKHFILAAAIASVAPLAAIADVKNPLRDKGSWFDIREDIIENVSMIQSGEAVLNIDAPVRAHDAAIVPVKITQSEGINITDMTLVVDENPAPMAAHFEFGPFVKASGGCSAPASKDAAIAEANRGKMKVKHFVSADLDRREVQVMIRHPNYSGLQRNQVTQLFVPPNFISELEVMQGDDLLFRMEGGISISENPTFRFKYNDNGAAAIRVRAVDTDGNIYQQDFGKDLI